MGVAKVTLNGTTLMDTTGMTVTSNTMVSAATALDKAGEVVTGNIATKTSNDITVNGSIVTVPAGVYNTAATKTVASAAAFAPAITLASSTGVVTGTNTFAAGYYSASTKTSTFNLTTQAGKTVTPTEAAQVAVSSYRWTTGTVSVAAISSNYVGTNVIRRSAADLTANLSTVTVAAGYYSSQVAKSITTRETFAPAMTLTAATGVVSGTNTFTSGYYAASTKSNTLNLTTQAAQTYTPTTTTQYISSYRWLTGSQTILGDANLVASNIASGVSIFGVTGTFEGGGGQTRTAYLMQCSSTSTFSTTLTYSGTQYKNLGSNTVSFTFVPGTNMTFSGSNTAGNINSDTQVATILRHNGSIVSYRSTAGTFDYTWQCPDNDLYIYFLASGGFDIYDDAGDIWTAGPYRFGGYTNMYGACWLYSNSKITYIGASKFHGTYGLTSINIPNVSMIAQSAFYSCSLLTNIEGPNIKQMDQCAFYGCVTLKDVTFPTCTIVGISAFAYCTALYSINLPLCTDLGSYAFSYCAKLSSISIPNVSDTIRAGTFYNCAFSDISFLPSTITTLENYAFQNCKSLTIVSHSNINTIGVSVFTNCTSLVEVNLPQCTSIGTSAFLSCKSLLTVNLPVCSQVTRFAFCGCENLLSINIPSCTSIDNDAFQACNNLSSINLPLCSSIGAYAFEYCSSLSNISIPICTSIGSYAFVNCSGLLNINLSACVSLSSYAFQNCSNLTSVILSACTYIGTQAFRGCWNLISVYLSSASVVPTLATGVFNSTPIGGYSTSAGRYGSVFVPASLYNSFITATNWATISSRIVSV